MNNTELRNTTTHLTVVLDFPEIQGDVGRPYKSLSRAWHWKGMVRDWLRHVRVSTVCNCLSSGGVQTPSSQYCTLQICPLGSDCQALSIWRDMSRKCAVKIYSFFFKFTCSGKRFAYPENSGNIINRTTRKLLHILPKVLNFFSTVTLSSVRLPVS